MSIKVLDPKVVSQIAAGEVVERPASVVKELVENALDAGSTQISVEVKGGGISLIRVTDNGAVFRITRPNWLSNAMLPAKSAIFRTCSISPAWVFAEKPCPVSPQWPRSRWLPALSGESAGTYLSLDDGKIIHHESQARSPGTTITVQNLFRKIPARLKFLKSESAEAGRIADIVSQYALAYPEVRFTLTD